MTSQTTSAADVLEHARRILAGTPEPVAASPAACCSSTTQATCCEPSEKADCCGATASAGGCGCQ